MIVRSGVTSRKYELPVDKDKAGEFSCVVLFGAVASADSAAFTVITTGLHFVFLFYSESSNINKVLHIYLII